MTEHIPEYDRIAAFDQDILDSRNTPRLNGEESEVPNAVASEYTQPIANEHKIFGCDLWIEVSDVSEKQLPE